MTPADMCRDLFETFMESQYWPRDRITAYQQQRLVRLVRHARDHVPFYGERLAEVVDSRGEIDWERWAAVPVLTREDLLLRGDALRSRALPRGHGGVTEAGAGLPPVWR